MLMWWRFTFLALVCVFVGSAILSASAQAPAIVVHPTNRVSFIGGSVIMSVTATGAPPLTYRWVKDGTPVARGTNRLLNLINLTLSDAGGYQAVVSNSFGVVTSRVASLTLTGAPPVIYLSPTNSTACPVTGAKLSVGASGSPPLRYQWFFAGEPIVNATSWTHPVQATVLGDYFVVVQNDFGTATSAVAEVTVGPRILVQPQSRTVEAGTGVEFSVVVLECPETRFQWRWNGLTVTNATNSTLRYGYPTGDFTGDVDVVVWDDYGSVTSTVARLTVNEVKPTVTDQPRDLREFERPPISNNEFFFQVGFTGAPRPALQWYFNDAALPGQTNPILRIQPAAAAQGFYHVVLSNGAGRVESRYAEFRMEELPPVIDPSRQPSSIGVCPPRFPTNLVSLSVGLTRYGWAPFSYQWLRNGEPIPDATNYLHFLRPLSEIIGDYVVVVTNDFGATTSQVAKVSTGVVITEQPQELIEADMGGYAVFSVRLEVGCNSATFQWQRDGLDLPGENDLRLVRYRLSAADRGDYRLVVRWNTGSITSEVSRLEVTVREPWITDQEPEDLEVLAGEWAHFRVTDLDRGAPAGDFQWLFNGQPIFGATNNLHFFIPDSPQQQGRYALVISNGFGSVTSRVALLKVLFHPPFFDYEPEDITIASGQSLSFSAFAVGAPPPSYQWLHNGVPMRWETNEFLELYAHGTNDLTEYSVVASNLLGSVTSRVATAHVELFAPGIYQQPIDRSVQAGEWVSFGAGVTSAPPASYQWFFEGEPIPGATSQSLQFVAGFSRQVGGYSVVASNPFGAVTSRVARLDIELMPPMVTVDPVSQNLVEGEVLWLRVMANVPVEVKWQLDGVDIADATNTTLRLRTTGPDDGGEYQAIVSNDQGTATSGVAQVTIRVAGPLDRWNWRSPKPQGNDLFDVAFGDSRFVAVGSRGGVVVSTNGVDWYDAHRVGHSESRTAIAHGNDVFVACEDGALVASPDGIDWHAVNAGFESSFGTGLNAYKVAFGNGRFVARLSDASVVISTNGFAWERVRATELENGGDGIFFVNGRFLVPMYLGFKGTSESGFAWSVDGVTWEVQTFLAMDYVASVACGENLCVGFSQFAADWLVLSSNGVDWVEHFLEVPLNMGPRAVAFGDGLFVVAGNPYLDGAGLAVSTNGLRWTPIQDIGTNEFDQVRFEDGRFIAVGNRGVLATSTNGVEWQSVSWGSELNFRSLARGNGLLVAVGNNGAAYSSVDGLAWTARDSGVTNNFRSVTWFRDRFVVVGESGDQGVTSTALTSVDGIIWETHEALGDLFSVSHNGRLLVAVGDQGTIVTSPDGANWNKLPSFVNPETWEGSPTSQDLNAITWTGTRFVAVGKDGVVITSTNGLSWTSSGPGGRKNLHGIAYGDGVYVTVANDGVYYVSTDAAIWWRGEWQTRDLSDVTYGSGRFMAVGDSGVMFTSEDGTNWIRRVTGCGNDLRFVTYSEGSYYAVGNNETILQSDQVDAALRISRLPAAGGVQVEVLGEQGRVYRLQGSANLATWTDLIEFTGGNEVTRLSDNSNTGNGWRFYRAVSP